MTASYIHNAPPPPLQPIAKLFIFKEYVTDFYKFVHSADMFGGGGVAILTLKIKSKNIKIHVITS